MKISRRFTGVLGSAAAVIAAGSFMVTTAGAQSVHFSGTTQACLNSATITAGCAQTEGSGAITFAPGVFNNTTVNGVAGFNGLGNNFGSLFTGATNYGPINQPFALQLNFVDPTITGGQNQLFTANLTGSINSSAQGGFVLHYDNPDLFFNFTQGTFSGNAHLKLSQDVGFDGGNIGLLNGSVTVTTPEPSSMALLGTGLIGLVPMVRRRKQK